MYCSYCQRKLGTWNWATKGSRTPKCVPAAGASESGAHAAKRARVDVDVGDSSGAARDGASEIELDLVSEHRAFCPWAGNGGEADVGGSAPEEEGSATLPSGWELCAHALIARRATRTGDGNGGAETGSDGVNGKMESKSPQDTLKTVRRMLSSFN